MQAPYPPTTPIEKIINVVELSCLVYWSMKAASKCAPVRRSPPIIIVFLGPYLSTSIEGKSPKRTLALTAKLNHIAVLALRLYLDSKSRKLFSSAKIEPAAVHARIARGRYKNFKNCFII